MFLNYIEELEFLQHNPESSIFLPFPIETRKLIAEQVTRCVLNAAVRPEQLSSTSHVRMVMECVGQAFGLPMHAADIIENATNLYRKWLLSSQEQPPPVQQNEQYFYREMFKHMSLLFQPRPPTDIGKKAEEEASVHVRLCTDVLQLLRASGRTLAQRMDTETWETLLKLVMGIADSLLTKNTGELRLADELTPLLLLVIFELMLRSRTTNDQMWHNFKHHSRRWRHRSPTIRQWNVACYQSTRRVIYVLLGCCPKTSKEDNRLMPKGDLYGFEAKDCSDEYAVYAWYRLLHVLGDLESIPTPNNYLEAMRGVRALVSLFTSPTRPPTKDDMDTSLSSTNGCDPNSILHILGHWLFEAINTTSSASYHEGKAEALRAVCSIFCSPAGAEGARRSPFLPEYLACFYRGIEASFKTQSTLLLAVILKWSTSIFNHGYDGSHILVPSYIYGIQRVLLSRRPLDSLPVSTVALRRSCIEILASLVCLPNHYHDVSFDRSGGLRKMVLNDSLIDCKPMPELTGYKDLAPYLGETLLGALGHEGDDDNRVRLLWLGAVFLLENMDAVPSFAYRFLTFVVGNVSTGNWSSQVVLVALLITSNLTSFYEKLVQANSETPQDIVITLCKYIEYACSAKKKKPPAEELVTACLQCLTQWALAGQWILTQKQSMRGLLRVISICLTGGEASDATPDEPTRKKAAVTTPDFHMPPDRTRLAAERLFVALFYQLGQFPPPSVGPSCVSSLGTEVDAVVDLKATPRHVSCFMMGSKALLSVIRFPTEQGGPERRVRVVIRNQTGRYEWDTQMNYFPKEVTDVPDNAVDVHPDPEVSLTDQSDGIDPEFLASLDRFLVDEKEISTVKALQKQVTDQRRAQNEALKAKNYGRDIPISIEPPAPVVANDLNDQTNTRLLLNHWGFLSMGQANPFGSMHTKPTPMPTGVQLNSHFNPLDTMNPRSCYKIAILYFPPPVASSSSSRFVSATSGFGSGSGLVVGSRRGTPEGESGGGDDTDGANAGASDDGGSDTASGNNNKPINNPCVTEEAVMTVRHDRTAREYREFVDKIGWSIDIAKHHGFLGGIDSEGIEHGKVAPYFANHEQEMICHVPSLMPITPATVGNDKKRHLVYSDEVYVSWVCDPLTFDPSVLIKQPMVHIVIHPQKSGLYRINILQRVGNNSTAIGPLMDGMVVSKHVLSYLVRQTAINSCGMFEPRTKPIEVRKYIIADMVEKDYADTPLHKFLASQFMLPVHCQ